MMRKVDEIQADWNDARGTTPCMKDRIIAAEQRLVKDVPDLLAEIERLKADLVQAHSATEKLSRGLWKVC